eukprot:962722_1
MSKMIECSRCHRDRVDRLVLCMECDEWSCESCKLLGSHDGDKHTVIRVAIVSRKCGEGTGIPRLPVLKKIAISQADSWSACSICSLFLSKFIMETERALFYCAACARVSMCAHALCFSDSSEKRFCVDEGHAISIILLDAQEVSFGRTLAENECISEVGRKDSARFELSSDKTTHVELSSVSDSKASMEDHSTPDRADVLEKDRKSIEPTESLPEKKAIFGSSRADKVIEEQEEGSDDEAIMTLCYNCFEGFPKSFTRLLDSNPHCFPCYQYLEGSPNGGLDFNGWTPEVTGQGVCESKEKAKQEDRARPQNYRSLDDAAYPQSDTKPISRSKYPQQGSHGFGDDIMDIHEIQKRIAETVTEKRMVYYDMESHHSDDDNPDIRTIEKLLAEQRFMHSMEYTGSQIESLESVCERLQPQSESFSKSARSTRRSSSGIGKWFSKKVKNISRSISGLGRRESADKQSRKSAEVRELVDYLDASAHLTDMSSSPAPEPPAPEPSAKKPQSPKHRRALRRKHRRIKVGPKQPAPAPSAHKPSSAPKPPAPTQPSAHEPPALKPSAPSRPAPQPSSAPQPPTAPTLPTQSPDHKPLLDSIRSGSPKLKPVPLGQRKGSVTRERGASFGIIVKESRQYIIGESDNEEDSGSDWSDESGEVVLTEQSSNFNIKHVASSAPVPPAESPGRSSLLDSIRSGSSKLKHVPLKQPKSAARLISPEKRLADSLSDREELANRLHEIVNEPRQYIIDESGSEDSVSSWDSDGPSPARPEISVETPDIPEQI